MSEKKILLLTPDFPPNEGGVARYLKAVAKHFSSEIEVLTDPHPAWQSFDPTVGYPISRLPLLSRFFWPRWLRVVKYLWTYKARYRTVLISHVIPFGTAAMVAQWLTHVPYVVIVHGMDIRLAQASARKHRMATRVLKGANFVVANSHALAQEVSQTYGIKEVLVVYPCLSEQTEAPAVHLPSQMFALLTVSRLVERKGHTHVLNALAHLRGTGELSSFVYHIVGEGPMEATLKSIVSALDLEGHVIFHGAISDEKRRDLYAQSDVFVMPVSRDPVDKEGFGLVFIEAGQAGLPSISTNISGVDEAVLANQTGILLSDQNEQELANAILVLYRNADLRTQLGLQAREHAKTFSCELQMQKLVGYL